MRSLLLSQKLDFGHARENNLELKSLFNLNVIKIQPRNKKNA